MEEKEQLITRHNTFDNYATEKVDAIFNNLLGDYNEKGEYVIKKEIVEELVLIKKVKKNMFNNSIFCEAEYGEKTLTFEIVFKQNSKQKLAKAELNLLEMVEKANGFVYNTIKTLLSNYTEVLSDDFINKALLVFNVMPSDTESVGKEYDENEEFNAKHIAARTELNNKLKKLNASTYDKFFEEYFFKRLNILERLNNEFSSIVLTNFNDEYSKIERKFLVNEKGKVVNRTLSYLLDMAIESASIQNRFDALNTKGKLVSSNFSKAEKEYNQLIEPFQTELINDINSANSKGLNKILNSIKKESDIAKEIQQKQDVEHAEQVVKNIGIETKVVEEKTKDIGKTLGEQKEYEDKTTLKEYIILRKEQVNNNQKVSAERSTSNELQSRNMVIEETLDNGATKSDGINTKDFEKNKYEDYYNNLVGSDPTNPIVEATIEESINEGKNDIVNNSVETNQGKNFSHSNIITTETQNDGIKQNTIDKGLTK